MSEPPLLAGQDPTPSSPAPPSASIPDVPPLPSPVRPQSQAPPANSDAPPSDDLDGIDDLDNHLTDGLSDPSSRGPQRRPGRRRSRCLTLKTLLPHLENPRKVSYRSLMGPGLTVEIASTIRLFGHGTWTEFAASPSSFPLVSSSPAAQEHLKQLTLLALCFTRSEVPLAEMCTSLGLEPGDLRGLAPHILGLMDNDLLRAGIDAEAGIMIVHASVPRDPMFAGRDEIVDILEEFADCALAALVFAAAPVA
eukprot:gnl/Ergobibamus_cyprinoides/278.p1 GENE.gnl/Ergobibamus_cyprinoides/278~~gnl/Ergobibamus_cyprinoides/278.p1  ORF type:complete len:276 (+),score=31.36 gnl/Ergobibamus_cyprinoides/278:76-828(+)